MRVSNGHHLTASRPPETHPPSGPTPPVHGVVPALPSAVILAGFVAYLIGWSVAMWLKDNGFFGRLVITDLPVYREYGEAMVAGAIPYRDFAVEYPPLALPTFWFPSLLSATEAGYREVFDQLMRISGAIGAAAVGAALAYSGEQPRRVALALGVSALSPILLVSLVTHHYDLWPALLTALGLAAAAAGRLRFGSALLVLGALAKVYPAVALPVLLIAAWRRNGAREASRTLLVAVLVAASILVPFVLLGWEGLLAALFRYADRPLQVEGLGGAVLLGLRDVLALDVQVVSSFGSQNVVGGQSTTVSRVLSVIQAACIVATWAWFASGSPTVTRLVRAAVAAIVAYVAFGKVLSPQYLVWLLPLVAMVAGPRGWAATVAVMAAAWATNLYFPARYFDLTKYDGAAAWVVVWRDLALVAAFIALVAPSGLPASALRRLASIASHTQRAV